MRLSTLGFSFLHLRRPRLRASPSRPSDLFTKVFADGVGKYVKLQQDLESSVPAQKSTNESEQIADRQHQLTGLIANARRGAHQGEIFTDEVAEHFHKIIRKAFREPGGQAMRQTIQERDPIKPSSLKVNEVYPDDQPRTTMPPTLIEPAASPAEGIGVSHHRPCPCSAGYQDEFDCGLHPQRHSLRFQ